MGMPTTYPSLGLDPCPGDPDALDALARRCRRAAHGLRADVDALRGAPGAAQWQGAAASAFRGYVSFLPRDLTRAAAAYDAVDRALRAYVLALRQGIAQARRADDEAAALDRLLRAARLQREVVVDDPMAVATADRRLAGLEEERAALHRRAGRLAAELDRAADQAARVVMAASEAPYHRPSLLHRLLDGAGEWVDRHAGLLTELSGVLKAVSAIAGVLSLIPVLAPFCGPIAVAAGLVALGIDAALAARGRASWRSLALDAGLTAVPGAGRAVRYAVREVRTARQTVVVYRVEGTANTRVVVGSEGDVTFRGNGMLFLNFGQQRRAEEFLAMRVQQGMPGASMKTFRVRREALEDLRARAADEVDGKVDLSRPLRVDVSRAPDQFGLRRGHVRELREHVVPGSGRVLR